MRIELEKFEALVCIYILNIPLEWNEMHLLLMYTHK